MGIIAVDVCAGDVLEYPADVLALKYAQDLYGADRAVYQRLSTGRAKSKLSLPDEFGFRLFEAGASISAEQVLFVGVVELYKFDYDQIRIFGRRVLESLFAAKSEVEHLALTIHGPGYGLDELEALESELSGLEEAVATGSCPQSLERISIVEGDHQRAQRLREALKKLLPRGFIGLEVARSRGLTGARNLRPTKAAGKPSRTKPFIFVAMPFVDSMNDIFHYGIQGAVRAAGYICERADLTPFVGDVMARVKQRIERASLVIADLTGANPNVYLEVGFAWGCGRPTVLIAREAPPPEFDVKGQRCLIYNSIKDLEEVLSRELKALITPAT